MPEWWATSDALRDVLVELGRLPPPQRTFALTDIKPGWLVLDNERERIGQVLGVADDYLVVRRARWRFFSRRLYVPISALSDVHEGVLVLNVSRRWIPSLRWGSLPRAARPAHRTP